MNSNFITRALCFHGQPMQKIWEDERGSGDLQQCGVPLPPNYSIYQERQRFFTFQDRAKRLKLHQFFARKAYDLYDADLVADFIKHEELDKTKTYFTIQPPYEMFVNKSQDKIKYMRTVLEGIKPGDIVYASVTKTNPMNTTIMVKPLCTGEPLIRYLSDIPIKAYLNCASIKNAAVDSRGKTRPITTNDFLCCEVVELSIDADRLYLGIDGLITKNKNVKLGVVKAEELPEYYIKANGNTAEKYDDCLQKSKEILNPNYNILFQINGLNVNDTFTFMGSLKQPFPRQEYAKELRQTQASKWAFRSVAEGIEHFKIGKHVEAFQCLNRALSIDPRNVEGLVARGALYANKGSFLKAVEDFEKALKLNSYHVNARKYMGETLVAIGRRYEEENRIKDATKAYKDCLNIIPNHEQARLSLEAIQQRSGVQLFENSVNNAAGTRELEKTRKSKKRESDDSDSDDSESDSSDTNSESTRSEREKKDTSLSPLSKRMAMHAASLEVSDMTKQQFNQPYFMASYSGNTAPAHNPNEFKLEDDDTESRVRKLLQEASKHKKEKTKKSKKKKSKKSKKSSNKDTDAATFLGKINFEEAYKAISGMTIENKLNKNLQIYEKTIAEIKKRQEVLQQSTSTASNSSTRQRSETPPPKAPSMKLQTNVVPFSTKPSTSTGPLFPSTASHTTAPKAELQPKLSFQIRRPVKIDKFGLVRVATPLVQKSPSHSRSRSLSKERDERRQSKRRSRSRSRSRTRDRSSDRRSRRRRSSRSSSRGRRRSYSRSNSSRSRSRSRYSSSSRRRRQSSYRSSGRRRTPSPFVPRDTPPPRRNSRNRTRKGFGNRVWQRPGYQPPASAAKKEGADSSGRWLHDKFYEDAKIDDGPSIEEIDEIINKAQKERKQEIINRDKDILKKPAAGSF